MKSTVVIRAVSRKTHSFLEVEVAIFYSKIIFYFCQSLRIFLCEGGDPRKEIFYQERGLQVYPLLYFFRAE